MTVVKCFLKKLLKNPQKYEIIYTSLLNQQYAYFAVKFVHPENLCQTSL